jgi:hypothetical protein
MREAFANEITKEVNGLLVLGTPIGSKEYVATAVKEKVIKAAKTLLKSRVLDDPQMELMLLRCCTGTPKMTYWQRTCDHVARIDSDRVISIWHILIFLVMRFSMYLLSIFVQILTMRKVHQEL